MFNYKRLTFIFLFISIFLLVTETQLERQSRKRLLSLFNIAVNESAQVTDTAPSSFIDTTENIRTTIRDFLSDQGKDMLRRADQSTDYLGMAFTIASYIILIFKYIASYIITFYPFIIFLFYMFFTSRFFKKDEFGYDGF
jgi:predicted PurR-regulated permease PerM